MAGIKGKQIEADTITANEVDTTDGGISTVNAGDAAVEGSGTGLSKRDHQHGVSTAAPPATSASAAAPAAGSASSLMRSDAGIQIDVSGTLDALAVGQAAGDGAGDGLALKTHSHNVPAATAVEITDSTNSAGTGGSFVHANHAHAHGNRGGGTLHSGATPSVAGFMSGADKTKLDSLSGGAALDVKDHVQLAGTAADGNITLSGEQTLDGVLTSTSRVLLKHQSSAIENGIYITAAGAWARSADMPAASGASSAIIACDQGTLNLDTIWFCTTDEGSDVVGTDGLTFALQSQGAPRQHGAGLTLSGNTLDVGANGDGSITVNADDVQVGTLATDGQHGTRGGGTQHAVVIAAGAAGFMSGADKTKLNGIAAGAEVNLTSRQEAVTTELITNSDTALGDTLNFTPASVASLSLFLNGVHQKQGAGFDYSISGTTITWLASSGTAVNMQTNDDLVATYLS